MAKMFTTSYEQTALVYMPDSSMEFATMARRPLPPPEQVHMLETGTPVAIRRYSDDAVIQWWPDGLVKMVAADGVKTYFWSKPTLADAVGYSKLTDYEGRGFFKFNGDGSVYGRCFGGKYYWGPDEEYTNPEMGEILMSQQDMDGYWTFVDEYDEADEMNSYHDICHCRGCDRC